MERHSGMRRSPEMACQEFVEVVTEYLEGALPPADRSRFEEHLEQCPPCKVYLDQIRETIRALGKLPEESIPEDAKRALLNVFRKWKEDLPK
jgi:anti-sigma factor RsiW